MSYGFQTLDESGRVLLDTTMQIGKLLQVVNVSGDGSVSDARVAGQQVFFGFQEASDVANPQYWFFGNYARPRLTLSGTTLIWEFPNSSWRSGARIFLGVR